MVEQLPEEYIVKIDSASEGDIIMLNIYGQKDYYSSLIKDSEMDETNSYIFIRKVFTGAHIISKKITFEQFNYTIYNFVDWFKIINFKETTIKTIL